MDQHIPVAVSNGLQRRGINVLTAQVANRCGFSDAEQLVFANAAQRVVMKFDADSLVLHHSGITHSGIAWCDDEKYSIGGLIQMPVLLHGTTDRAGILNHLEYL